MANRDRTAVETGLNDLLGNVIQSDRLRSGREPLSDPPTITEPSEENQPLSTTPVMTRQNVITIGEDSPITHYDTMTRHNESEPTSAGVSPPKRKPSVKHTETSPIDDRITQADIMADSPTMTVTLRIPKELNDWLDEYVHRSWPQKVRKQGLVIEALKMLYARRGRAGEEILETPFLEEGDA